MKRYLLIWSFVTLVGLLMPGMGKCHVSASTEAVGQNSVQLASNQQAAPTLIPTTEPVTLSEPTPERVLPPVGSNAILVIGATVLVLIIIGGVLGSRLRAKH